MWRRLMVAIVLVVMLFSLLYTLRLVRQVSERERENARIWIHTIKQQRKLISDLGGLFESLDEEEKRKIKLWAKAVKRLPLIENNDKDFNLVFDLVKNNESIPAILTDNKGQILYVRNIEESYGDRPIAEVLAMMNRQYRPVKLDLPDDGVNYLYYGESKIHQDINLVFDELINSYLHDIEHNVVSVPVLYMDSTKQEVLAYGNLNKNPKLASGEKSLEQQISELQQSVSPIKVGRDYLYIEETDLLIMVKFFPVVFVVLVLCFVLVFYFYLNTSQKYEQNFLWVGMSKETAHQLGTPISSLMAWVEVLKEGYKEEQGFKEIQKDVDRLELIADRFSKIGSLPKLGEYNLSDEVEFVMSYMQPRISPHVSITIDKKSDNLFVLLNKQLLGWVFENLMKNAVDAMSGKGKLDVRVFAENGKAVLEVEDTGCGIRKNNFRKVFKAGYSSKKRGWGLGLALAKRIVEEYHSGKIYVKSSREGKGAIMRIELGLLEEKNKS